MKTVCIASAVKVMALAAVLCTGAASHAMVSYTYTGPALTNFSNGDPAHTVNASGLVASFVFNNLIPANTGSTDNFQTLVPVSWSVTGGGYSLSSTDVGATLAVSLDPGITVFTDASGSLMGWDYLAYTAPDGNGPRFRSFFYPTGQGSLFGPAIKLDAAFYWNLPTGISLGETQALTGGSWTVTAVPEPAPAAMLLAGLGAIGWLARRRVHA